MDRSQIAFDIGVMAYVYSWYEKSLLVICFGKKNVSCKVRNPFHMGLTLQKRKMERLHTINLSVNVSFL